jgi:hypothetical protein
MNKTILLLTASLGLAAAPGVSGALVYVTGAANQFGTIDVSTRQYTQISANLGGVYSSLTWNPAIEAFYTALNDFSLRTIKMDGTVSAIGSMGGSMYGLAFNPATTVLYGQSYATDTFGTVNKTSGAYTPIDYPGIYVSGPIGGRLSFHDGTLYGAAKQSGTSNGKFGTINPATGQFTQIGANSADYLSMILASDESTLYGIAGQVLYTINSATGVATSLGAITGNNLPGSFLGADFIPVPEPGQWAMMMGVTLLGVAGYALRQHRRKAA